MIKSSILFANIANLERWKLPNLLPALGFAM